MKDWLCSHSAWALVFALGVGGTLAACGGSQSSAEAPSEGAKPFSEMTAPEKMKHMKQVVKPHMAKVFQEASAEAYADFNCTSCHGPGAKKGEFEMPTDALPKLNQEEMEEHPEVTKFMKERVVPEMAKLLGEEPYNMETGKGFGCYDCHMQKEESAAPIGEAAEEEPELAPEAASEAAAE